MSNQRTLKRVRAAIRKHFWHALAEDENDQVIDRIINGATFLGEEDPGQWSPSAQVVVHCESGLPSGLYEPFYSEKWYEVDNELGDLYHEPINSAVLAFYEAW